MARINRQLVSLIAAGCLTFSLATTAQAESTLAKIQRTGVLSVAIREDAPPLGYLDANNNLQGYCLDFFALLETQLINKLKRNSLSVKLLKSNPDNRFRLVDKRIVDLECGPNTITEDISANVDFSSGFFITGTQFLVRQNHQIDVEENLRNKRLGIIANTSTEKFVAQRYPTAIVRRYRGVTARARGIEAIEQGKIDAMISDGILLRAEAQQLGLSATEYPLIPDVPLTCDRYGMIIRSQDTQWQDFVNSVIDSPEAAEIASSWFGSLFNYAQSVPEQCS